MEEEARRYQVELNEIRARNEQIHKMIEQKREQQLTQQFMQSDEGVDTANAPQFVV